VEAREGLLLCGVSWGRRGAEGSQAAAGACLMYCDCGCWLGCRAL